MNVSTFRIPSVRMRISLLAATVLLVSGATTAWIQDGTEDPRAEFCPAIALGTIKVEHTIPNVGLVTFYRAPSAVKPGDLTTPITGHPRADYSPASYKSGNRVGGCQPLGIEIARGEPSEAAWIFLDPGPDRRGFSLQHWAWFSRARGGRQCVLEKRVAHSFVTMDHCPNSRLRGRSCSIL